MTGRHLIRYSVALALLGTPVVLADDAAMGGNQPSESKMHADMGQAMTARASKLIGMNVYNDSGESLGEINELVLDGANNRISYAVLSFGGWMGIHDKLFAIPWNQFQQRGAEPNKLYLNVPEDQLKSAPGFDKNHWPDNADRSYWQGVDKYYPARDTGMGMNNTDRNSASGVSSSTRTGGTAASHDATAGNTTGGSTTGGTSNPNGSTSGNPSGTTAGAAADATANTSNTRTDTSTSSSGNGSASASANASSDNGNTQTSANTKMDDGIAWNRKVSDVIGAKVRNAQNEKLGDIKDLVIDTSNGHVRYAVVSFGGWLGIGDKLFAVPMSALQQASDKEQFTMNVTKDQMKNAPGFDDNAWPDFANPQWGATNDAFYGGTRNSTQAARE